MATVTPITDYLYERRSSPFLALTRGSFEFLHTSPNGQTGIAFRQLSVAPLGHLSVPSGQLLIGDPFSMLQHENNVWFPVPKGKHQVLLTQAAVGEDKRLTAGQRAAYVSVVFDAEALARRQDEQRIRLLAHDDPSVPFDRLHPTLPVLPDGYFSEAEARQKSRPGIAVLSGSIALSDVRNFEALMPPNLQHSGRGWLERFFEHGIPGSWFDAMDAEDTWPKACCNVSLPDATNGENIVICPTGWGDGRYPVILETEGEKTIALHLDFQVVPHDFLDNPNFG